MNAILNIGKYLYVLPFAVFGVFHLINAKDMTGVAFGSEILVYITGVALLAGVVSMLIGKLDKLAATLLALFLILTAVLVHLTSATGGAEPDIPNLLKDLALAGAAMMYAKYAAKDNAVIGG